MQRDKDYRRMIQGARWQGLRRRVLSDRPLCERCAAEGYVTAATEVHHRTPVESGVTAAERRRLMYDAANLAALCHDCHVRTHTEMGRGTRAEARRRAAAESASAISRFFGDSDA